MIIQYYCYLAWHSTSDLMTGFSRGNLIFKYDKLECNECEWIVPGTIED